MKRNTPQHHKLDALMEILDIPRYAGVGLLESLWHITAASTPGGDIGKYTNAAIAKRLDWASDADELIDALCESGWIDKSESHRLIVHDWSDHAEDSVHMKLGRAGKTFANGAMPDLKRLTKDERTKCYEKIEANRHTTSTQNVHAVHIPQEKASILSDNGTYDPSTQNGHGVSTAQALAKANAIAQVPAAAGNGETNGDKVFSGGDGDRGPMSDVMAKLGSRINLHHGQINQHLVTAGVESDRVRNTICQRKDLTPQLVEQVIQATRLDPATNAPPRLIAHRLQEMKASELEELVKRSLSHKETA